MKNIDFMKNADNVYTTMNYIVVQKFAKIVSPAGNELLLGVDSYYKRTLERDKQFAKLYCKNKKVRGARIYCNVYKRIYCD